MKRNETPIWIAIIAVAAVGVAVLLPPPQESQKTTDQTPAEASPGPGGKTRPSGETPPSGPAVEREETDAKLVTETTPAPGVAMAKPAAGASAIRLLSEDEWKQRGEAAGLSLEPSRAFIRRQIPVEVDFLPLDSARHRAGGKVTFDLGLGRLVSGEVTRVVERSPSSYTLQGTLEGDPLNEFSVSVQNDAAVGTFNSSDFGVRQLRYAGEGIHKIQEIDPSLAPGCGTDPEVHAAGLDPAAFPPPVPLTPEEVLRGGQSPAKPLVEAAEADEEDEGDSRGAGASPPVESMASTTLDVMVVYSTVSLTKQGGFNAMLALINQGIDDTNLAFQNSLVDAEVRLVHTEEVSYTGSSGSPALSALRSTTDGVMDEVHALRDSHGADFVSMWHEVTDVCGVGYLMRTLSTGFARNAFNLTDPDCQFKYTFTHELGHNFGCAHAVGDNGTQQGRGLYNWSHGWRWNGTNSVQYRSVMAYSPGSRIRHFSNPNVLYQGTASGRANTEDNARGLNSAKETMAMFRTSVSDDHGDTISTATPVGINTLNSGTLEITSDVDVFQITVPVADTLTVRTSGSTNTFGRLLNAGGGVIESDSSGGSGSNFEISRSVSAGTYYVEVLGEAGDSGNYQLQVSAGDDDHGNNSGTATSVNFSSTTPGEIEYPGDEDFFRVVLPNPGILQVSTTGSTDTAGQLRSSGGSIIESDNNDGIGNNFLISRAVAGGTYYVRVIANNVNDTGLYNLVMSFTEIPDDHGNGFDESTDVTLGTISSPSVVAGEIEFDGDLDFFRFTVSPPGADESDEGEGDEADGIEVTLDIEGPPAQPPNSAYGIAIYHEESFTMKPLGAVDTSPPFRLSRVGSGNATSPDNGGAYLRLATGNSLEVFDDSNRSFDAVSVDLSEYSTVFPEARSIVWKGYKVDGSTVTHTFVIDGVIDGTGPLADFETFVFPATFVSLVRLETRSDRFSIDNLVVSLNSGGAAIQGLLEIGATGVLDTEAVLYDGSFNQLESRGTGGPGSNFEIRRYVTPGTYFLKVEENGGNNTGNYSLFFGYDDPGPPEAPGALTATGDLADGIDLSWDAALPGADGYQVYRNTVNNSGSAVTVGDPVAGLSSSDTTAVPGTVYYYWVRAFNLIGEGPFSPSATGERTVSAPLGITATGLGEGVRLDWNAAPGATEYRIHRGTSPSGILSTRIATVPGGTSHLDETAVAGRLYYYFVRSIANGKISFYSGGVAGRRLHPAPETVVATDGFYDDKVRLSWSEVINASEYAVFRNTLADIAGAVEIVRLGSGTRDFDDPGATPGTPYFYSVRAVMPDGREGALSQWIEGSISAVPAFLPDGHIGKKPVSMVGDDVHNQSGIGQTIKLRSKKRKTLKFYIELENDGVSPDTVTVLATRGNSLFRATYFELRAGGGRINVTAALTAGTHEAALGPGEGRDFHLDVKRKGRKNGRLKRKLFSVWGTSETVPDRRDVVKGKAESG